jgi:signal peptidase I
VVFRFPHEPSIQYVKRLVALGGDTVEVRDGRLFVNGREAARTALDHPCAPEAGAPPCTIWREELGGRSYLVTLDEGPRKDRFGPVTVPAGHAFVIGDHRDHSVDSRSWGTVPDALLVGRPRFVWWSGGNDGVRWGRINAPVE